MKSFLVSSSNIASPLLWLIGLSAALMPLPAYEAESFLLCFVLVCSAFLLTLCDRISKNELTLPFSIPVVIAGLFWTLTLFSVFLSAVPTVSFIYFCFFSVFPLTVLTVCVHHNPRYFLTTVAKGLALIYTALSIFALLQYFLFPDMLFKGLVHKPLANPNSLAALLMLGAFGGFGWMLGSSSRIQSNLALILTILIVSAILTTGSRGALLSLIAGLIAAGFFLKPLIKKHWRCGGILILSSALAFLIIGTFSQSTQTPMDILGKSMTGRMPLLHSRPQIWEATWHIIQDYFWTGTGIGTFYLYYPEYRLGDLTSAGRMAHNDPLQFWAELGVLGPILFYAFGIACLMRTVKSFQSDSSNRLYIVITAAALGALVIHTHVTFNFYVLSVLMVCGLFLGLWFWKTENKNSKLSIRLNSSSKRKTFLLLCLTAMATILYGFTRLQLSYIAVNRARLSISAGNLETFSKYLDTAHLTAAHYNANAHILSASQGLGILENIDKINISKDQLNQLYNETSNHIEKAQNLNPRLSSALFARARLLVIGQQLGYPESLQKSPSDFLHQALIMDPTHLGARIMLADYYAQNNNKEKTLQILRDGLDLPYQKQNPVAYYQKTAWLAAERGDMPLHQAAIQKLLRYKRTHSF